MARRLLSLSPHYIYVPSAGGTKLWPSASEIEAELDRNRATRRELVHDLVLPGIGPESVVLDYGCGPGFAAVAAAREAAIVYGVDVVESVLRSAAVINGRKNVHYIQLVNGRISPLGDDSVDLTYSFAVFQHVTDRVCHSALAEIARVTRRGGRIILHVALDTPGWRSESEWFADRSPRGRIRRRVGLHCFGRSRDQIIRLVRGAGFENLELAPASSKTAVDDDIRGQHILTAILPS